MIKYNWTLSFLLVIGLYSDKVELNWKNHSTQFEEAIDVSETKMGWVTCEAGRTGWRAGVKQKWSAGGWKKEDDDDSVVSEAWGTLHNAHAGDLIDGMGCVRLRHVSLSHGLLSGGDILIVPHSFCHAFDSLVS